MEAQKKKRMISGCSGMVRMYGPANLHPLFSDIVNPLR
jgi:hypothetical protein